MMACVLREVAPGDFQYVPVSEVPVIKTSDVIYIGPFRASREQLGPYGSHTRTICLPLKAPEQFQVCDLQETAPDLHKLVFGKLDVPCCAVDGCQVR